MRNTKKAVALLLLVICMVSLSSCWLLMGEQEPVYDIVGTWRREVGENKTTITYYLKADGTFSYSNNVNGNLNNGTYSLDRAAGILHLVSGFNRSMDENLPCSFSGPDTLIIDGNAYSRH